jgi:hypothetical protein
MDRISALLTETVYLWAATAVVVVIASAIHYVVASSNFRDLKKRVGDQEQRPQPQDTREWSSSEAEKGSPLSEIKKPIVLTQGMIWVFYFCWYLASAWLAASRTLVRPLPPPGEPRAPVSRPGQDGERDPDLERNVLEHAAAEDIVGVIVRVDEARDDELVGAVDDLRATASAIGSSAPGALIAAIRPSRT